MTQPEIFALIKLERCRQDDSYDCDPHEHNHRGHQANLIGVYTGKLQAAAMFGDLDVDIDTDTDKSDEALWVRRLIQVASLCVQELECLGRPDHLRSETVTEACRQVAAEREAA